MQLKIYKKKTTLIFKLRPSDRVLNFHLHRWNSRFSWFDSLCLYSLRCTYINTGCVCYVLPANQRISMNFSKQNLTTKLADYVPNLFQRIKFIVLSSLLLMKILRGAKLKFFHANNECCRKVKSIL